LLRNVEMQKAEAEAEAQSEETLAGVTGEMAVDGAALH